MLESGQRVRSHRNRRVKFDKYCRAFDGAEDAAKHAVQTATKTLRDLRVAEVNKLDLVIIDGKVTAYRARVNVSFKYEEKD